MPNIKVNDINMYYEIHGNGYPFLLIRGLSSDVYRWPPDFVKETSQFFRVILFDNRGAGRTDKPDIEYSINMMADDTVGLMKLLGIERANVLGFSMGGAIAQEIAINYPERVEKLILCGAGCGGTKSVPISNETRSVLTSNREGLSPEEALRETLPILFPENFIKNNEVKIEEFVKRATLAPIPPYSYRRQLAAALAFDSYDRLKNINTPTLAISGKEDILVPPQNSEILVENIKGAKIRLIENVGHDMFSQEPLLVAKIVLEFLR